LDFCKHLDLDILVDAVVLSQSCFLMILMDNCNKLLLFHESAAVISSEVVYILTLIMKCLLQSFTDTMGVALYAARSCIWIFWDATWNHYDG
jgi:hypothetical protein